MPIVITIDGVKNYIHNNDHNPPHFHASFAEYEIQINIISLEVINGELPKRKMKKIMSFARENQDFLLNIWNNLI